MILFAFDTPRGVVYKTLLNWRGTQVVTGTVCKTVIRRFDPAPRLKNYSEE